MFQIKPRHSFACAAIFAGAFALTSALPALAQGNSPAGCQTAAADAAKEPATKPAPDSKDGTSPGNTGSTGWSGGTGGSNIGTSPAGTVAGGTFQPATARGLDLAGSTKAPC